MHPLDLTGLTILKARATGSVQVRIGLIDGPVSLHLPEFEGRLQSLNADGRAACGSADSSACRHGTFVAGLIAANEAGIAPGCTLLVRPVFTEDAQISGGLPATTPAELAAAILECVDAGVHVINLSLALAQPSMRGEAALDEALHVAGRRGVIVVAAAGNQGLVGSSPITRHPCVIPVVACDAAGKPLRDSNLSGLTGRRGLRAPGEQIAGLGADGRTTKMSGTSAATPFVTGAIALLWSAFPAATAAQLKLAITQTPLRRASVVPPLLDAAAAYTILMTTVRGDAA